MTAQILDGKHVASLKNTDLSTKIKLLSKGLRPPCLAVIQVGTHTASSIYVKTKKLACASIGIHTHMLLLPHETTQNSLCSLIDDLNDNTNIDGILVQMPLPDHIAERAIIERIHPEKDVDGFHPYNLGRLAQGEPLLRPCTSYGIINLLEHYQLSLAGKNAIVIGTSNHVGRPMALELLLKKATVTQCHRQTKNLKTHVELADVIIVATGCRDVIHADWLRKNQILVDVGIHRLSNGTLRGDVDFHAAKKNVAWITPVPGGVGPMTVSMLLHNTLYAYEKLLQSKS